MLSALNLLLLVPLFRPTVSLILGVVVFLASLGFAAVDAVGDRFLTSGFYLDNLAENDVYARIYDEVLLDPEFADTTQELMGGVQVPRRDVAGLAREIIPPGYLQDQVEGAVRATIDYVGKDTDDLRAFIDLGPSLERMRPTLLAYIDRHIAGLPDVPVDSADELERSLVSVYRHLGNGKLEEMPGIPAIGDPSASAGAYRRVLDDLAADPDFPRGAIAGLEKGSAEMEARMREGRVRDAVRASVPTLTSPLMAGAIDELKKDLDGRSRVDLVQKAAEQTGPTREDFLEQFDIVREVVARGWVAKWLMLLVMAGAGLVMAGIHLPRMASALRFPGLALLFSGLLVLALGLVSRYRLLGEPLNREGADSIPPTLVDIANDVFASMASDIGSGFIAFAIVLAIVGLTLAVGSAFIRMTRVPFLSK